MLLVVVFLRKVKQPITQGVLMLSTCFKLIYRLYSKSTILCLPTIIFYFLELQEKSKEDNCVLQNSLGG